jgi:glycosyltransferase involved in cell wall biosynthesis
MASALEITQVVRSDTFAGVERYVCLVSNALMERGHTVRVVGGDPARMRRELRGGIDHVAATSTHQASRALIRGGRVELVHAHMTAAEVAALAARPWNRAPVVSTRHFPDERGRRMPPLLSGLIRRCLAEQIAISEFVARNISEPSVLVHNGVSCRTAATLEPPAVLMMQRLEPEKQPDVGLRAWADSGLAACGWRLTVAGEGRLMPALRILAEKLQISESVRFFGHATKTDPLLDGSSIFLAPAPAEPFGLAVVEAMAHGVPVVAAHGGAHPETIGAKRFLFPPGDVEAAAAQLVALAEDRALRVTEGKRLRLRQQQLFSVDRQVDALEEVYSSVLRRQQ